VAGRFPLFTDENVDGPIIRGLRQRGWDVQHATEELGEETKDISLLEYATSLERVMVSTDKHLLHLGERWVEEGRDFRLIWWEQKRTQRILLQTVLDAFDEIAAEETPFSYPIRFLKLPK
jgi:predicted nuclease of predicted toxin-antitoxin system